MQVVIASLGSIVKPGLSCCCHWDLTLVIVMGNFSVTMEVVVDLQRRWCLILVLGSGFVDHRRQLCQDPQVNYYSLASLDYMIAQAYWDYIMVILFFVVQLVIIDLKRIQ